MLAIWSLVPLPFLNPSCTSGSFQFSYCWSLACRIFEHYLASMWNECSCTVVWTFFGIALLWDCNENWPFPALWSLLSFPNLLRHWEIIGKDPDAAKDQRQEEKGMTEDEIVGWHHPLNEHEFEQALGVGDGQGSLACCSHGTAWDCKESGTSEWLNWVQHFNSFIF